MVELLVLLYPDQHRLIKIRLRCRFINKIDDERRHKLDIAGLKGVVEDRLHCWLEMVFVVLGYQDQKFE